MGLIFGVRCVRIMGENLIPNNDQRTTGSVVLYTLSFQKFTLSYEHQKHLNAFHVRGVAPAFAQHSDNGFTTTTCLLELWRVVRIAQHHNGCDWFSTSIATYAHFTGLFTTVRISKESKYHGLCPTLPCSNRARPTATSGI